MSETFEGDVLIFDTLDGGEISIVDGLVEEDKSFRTAVYLSLFGGNKDDNGVLLDSKTWWGNFLDCPENERMVSRFQNVICSMPLTSKTIKDAEEAVQMDLAWMVDEGICDKIESKINVVSGKEIELKIKIMQNGQTVENSNYSLQWGEASGI